MTVNSFYIFYTYIYTSSYITGNRNESVLWTFHNNKCIFFPLQLTNHWIFSLTVFRFGEEKKKKHYSLELLEEGAMMANVLPKALKNGTDMVADGKFVVKLAGGSCMFHVCNKKRGGKQIVKAMYIQHKRWLKHLRRKYYFPWNPWSHFIVIGFRKILLKWQNY